MQCRVTASSMPDVSRQREDLVFKDHVPEERRTQLHRCESFKNSHTGALFFFQALTATCNTDKEINHTQNEGRELYFCTIKAKLENM
jgi:hypothetical protein